MFFSKKYYDFESIPDLSGKIAVITGSSAGIGKVCALEMARKGCHVVLACRSEDKAQAVIDEIKKETGNDKLEFIPLNLMSLQSVKAFAETYKQRHDTLDILMNNAGTMMCPFGLSDDGIETQVATNHVGHFFLTTQLLPVIEKSRSARIVNVSSMGHRMAFNMNLEHINDPKKYDRTAQYGRSKAFNILFTRELTRRLQERGVDHVYVNCNHPGVVRSELTRHLMSVDSILTTIYNKLVTITTEDGSLTQMYLATSPEVEEKKIKGKYYVPYAQPGCVSSLASSDENAKTLWEFTENLLKEKVPGYEGSPI
ncbi:hypothetical protein BC940DRAFT_308977 [Gongronella butleri]|nr:hypothetical protein BC940DRAFT_308977 [Gongronella butleri]